MASANTCIHRHTSHWMWWHRPLIPALGRQRQADLYELEASLVYRESSRSGLYSQIPWVWSLQTHIKLTCNGSVILALQPERNQGWWKQGTASLAFRAEKQRPSSNQGKVKINNQGCPLLSTHTPWHIHAHVYTYIHHGTHMPMCTHTHHGTYMSIYIHTYPMSHACPCVHTPWHIHAHVYIYTPYGTYMPMFTHTHTHTEQ